MTFVSNFENLEISESRRRSPRGRRSVLSTIREDGRFSTLVKVLENSRAIGDLDSSKEEFTLFAPTNHAFKKLQERVAFQSMDDQDLVMEEVVRYHMIRGPVVYSQNLYQGQLLTTELRERSLDGAFQKIRIDRVAGNVRLNDLASVSETDIDAANGVVHVLDNVLIPPDSIYDQICKMPVQFSIFTTAMQQCRLEHDAAKDKAITCLIPNNEAWQELNKEDVSYLFSRAGATDLKRIVEYHMVKDLVYARDVIQDRNMELNTFDHRERIGVSAIQRFNIPNLDEYNPNDWIITVNGGEAKIIAADFLSRNGNVHEISSVLIPESVVLPSMSGGRRGRRDGERRRWDGRRDGRRSDDEERRRRRRRSLQ